ncbi:MAG: DUF1800 family protein [Planctomycetota bacterium]
MRCFQIQVAAAGMLAVAFGFLSHSATAGTFEVSSRTEMTDLMLRIRATQFLQRATFGPRESDIDDLVARMKSGGIRRALSEWVDEQFALPASSHVQMAKDIVTADGFEVTQSGIGALRYRDHAWWHIACTADDQLRQRVAWALSQICVVGRTGANFSNVNLDRYGQPHHLGVANYYDMLVNNADQTYRKILEDVTFHPCMGVFLSHLRNNKGDPANGIFPDENYAREIMQLFSIGLYELRSDGVIKTDAAGEPIPTYDNETIKAFARLFTGFNYNRTTRWNQNRANLHEPMIIYDEIHDFGPKTLLNGQTLQADADGKTDIQNGLDNLYSHPNVAPFISRLLIQRLVRSNPSRYYLARVSRVFNNNGQGVKGDMKAVVKAILTDRECWDSIRVRRLRNPLRVQVRTTGTERVKLIEPVLAYAHLLRNYETPRSADGYYRVSNMEYHWVQAVYKSPSVFNFYLPSFQPAGPLATYTPSRRIPNGAIAAPEFQLQTAVVANRTANRFRSEIRNRESNHWLYRDANNDVQRSYFDLDFSQEETIAENEGAAALAEHLDLKLCGGTMSETLRSAITNAVSEDPGALENRVTGAIMATYLSPDFMIVE